MRSRALPAADEACNWYPGACVKRVARPRTRPAESAISHRLPESPGPAANTTRPARIPFQRQDIGQPCGVHQPLRGQRREGPGPARRPSLQRNRKPVRAPRPRGGPDTMTSSLAGDHTG